MIRKYGWFAVGCFLISAAFVAVIDWGHPAGSIAWAAICMCWPAVIAWHIGKSVAEKRARNSKERQEAINIVARAIRHERGKASFWLQASWRELEVQIAALFRRMGYSAKLGPGSNDKGVDVLAEKGSERIVIQCKQYKSPAQRAPVSELLGCVVAEGGSRGILICTAGFTESAQTYAMQHGIELWDLHRLMQESQGS